MSSETSMSTKYALLAMVQIDHVGFWFPMLKSRVNEDKLM